jgi:ABC-2 type transport system permease protein
MNHRLLAHQVRLEQLTFWRNPEAAFFTFALPIGLLLIFGSIGGGDAVPGRPDLDPLTLFVPGILAFGIIVAAYGTLAATISTLRAEGVLKRLRGTPLPPSIYLGGHLVSVVSTCLVVAATTIVLGRIAFDAAPRTDRLWLLACALALGIVCFAALGLAISAAIRRPEASGAITNGTYLPLALVSGTFSSGIQLPNWLDTTVSAFPIKALTTSLRAVYDPAAGMPVGALVVMTVWAVAGVVLAQRFFRWDPA